MNKELVREKKASRTVISQAMDRSRDLYLQGEALLMEARIKEEEAEDAIRTAQAKANEKARKERSYASAHHANVTKKHEDEMKKLRQRHEAVLRSNSANFEKKKEKWVKKMDEDRYKLERERQMWRAKLAEAEVKLDKSRAATLNEKGKNREYMQKMHDEVKRRENDLRQRIEQLENMGMS